LAKGRERSHFLDRIDGDMNDWMASLHLTSRNRNRHPDRSTPARLLRPRHRPRRRRPTAPPPREQEGGEGEGEAAAGGEQEPMQQPPQQEDAATELLEEMKAREAAGDSLIDRFLETEDGVVESCGGPAGRLLFVCNNAYVI
jgi:hypothetical protein